MGESYTGEHLMLIGQDFLSGEHEVECSCGWAAGAFKDEASADEAWDNHCDVVFMEATGG